MASPPDPSLVPATVPPGAEDQATVGPYRLLRPLGEGGMGLVYLAEQSEPVRRQVALKLLKPGMDSRQVIARFESERQALAVMEHPSIARVFDAGATPTGLPYFVMEHVDGVPITEFCDSRRLSPRERARLFVQVCRAVQHAHQKGVIHRDLKPSNVLVTAADGEPLCKIIDFGIARAVERDGVEAILLTRVDQPVGTPAYMSPEQAQASGLDVDTRTDLYSLGVLLYQLLAGVLPFEPRAYQGYAFLAHHLGDEPPAPAARFAALDPGERARIAALRSVDPAGLQRELRGDLGWVVAKAMERDRERRYETANGLAADLERCLAHEAVAAGPPSRSYRARKFVRRHRAGVSFTATLLVLLVAFAASMSVQAQRIARAHAIAEARQAQAEDLIGFMVGDLRTRLTPIGRLDVLDEVGARALAYFAAVPDDQLSDAELFRRAEALRQIGEVRLEQGALAGGVAALRQSLPLARGLARRDPANAEWQLGAAFSHYWIGYAHFLQAAPDSALPHFREYERITAALVALFPDSARFRLESSYAHNNVGSALEAQGDLRGALRAYQATLDAKLALVAHDPANREYRSALANSHNKLAVVQRKLGELDQALANQEAELALREALLREAPDNAQAQMLMTFAHLFLGGLLEIMGRAERAMEQSLRGLERARALVAHDPDNARWRRTLAVATLDVGARLLQAGDPAGALRHLQEAETVLSGLDRSREYADSRHVLAETRTARAAALRESGRAADALAPARASLALLDSVSGGSTDDELRRRRAEAHIEHGRVLAALARPAEARDAWTAAVRVLEPAGHSGNTDHLVPLALALTHLQDPGAAAVLETLRSRGVRRADLAAAAGGS